jgi:protein-disulfide isomerase
MAKRSTRNRIEQRRAQRQRRSRRTILIVGVLVVAVVVVGVVIALTGPGRGAVAAVDTNYDGLTQEVDRTGEAPGFAIGDPDAPVTLIEYSDFSCPHCHDLSGTIDRLIEEDVAAGDLRIVYKPVSFVNPPYSRPAAQAAICAAEQGKFWEMHDQIWALYNSAGPGAYTQRQLAAAAEAIGLDGGAFRSCFVSSDTSAQVDAVLSEAQVRGINGTPTLYLNGQQFPYRGAETAYADLKAAIEAELSS